MPIRARLVPIVLTGLTLTCCGGTDTATRTTEPRPTVTTATAAATESTSAAGLRLVSAGDAQATIESAPDDLVILDVRTPEEFAEGHVDGAIMIDFYREDFAAELAKLDPDVPYVLYCRSGNRSGQTIALMDGLEFQDVQDVDGGILAWQDAGLPLVTE